MSFDYFFWFAQPSTFLNAADKTSFYVFLGLVAAAVIMFLIKFAIRHETVRKLVSKFFNLALACGLIGLAWFGMRYENVPIFGRRYWAGLIVILFVVWLLYIIKYSLTGFREEKAEYDKYLLNSKYMPGRK